MAGTIEDWPIRWVCVAARKPIALVQMYEEIENVDRNVDNHKRRLLSTLLRIFRPPLLRNKALCTLVKKDNDWLLRGTNGPVVWPIFGLRVAPRWHTCLDVTINCCASVVYVPQPSATRPHVGRANANLIKISSEYNPVYFRHVSLYYLILIHAPALL